MNKMITNLFNLLTNIGTEIKNKDEISRIMKVKIADIQTDEQFVHLFPINPQVLESIKLNIKKRGYDKNFPIILWKNKMVLIDGHTRMKSCIELGITEIYAIFVPFRNHKEALNYALHVQGSRRNLRDQDIFQCVIALDNRKNYRRYKNCSTEQEKDKSVPNGRSGVREKIAKTLNISVTKVQKCLTLIDKADKRIKDKIKDGKLSINSAYNYVQKKEKEKKVKLPVIKIIEKGHSLYLSNGDELIRILNLDIDFINSDHIKDIRKFKNKVKKSLLEIIKGATK
jgi:ParB-like chromosome segregation protein Spo0J